MHHVKKSGYRAKLLSKQYAKRYTQGQSMLDLARQNKYSPYLFARVMVEEMTNITGRKGITRAMRDPIGRLGHASAILDAYQDSEHIKWIRHCNTALDPSSNQLMTPIPTTRLANEVIHVMELDPMNGPLHDAERNRIGIEYEHILEQCLHTRGIPFETEKQLCVRGSARTPDILLSIPVGVKVTSRNGSSEWKVVCWMDSKALFGDEATHKDSTKKQAESYIHRYGPGLVIYWFGHAPLELLDDSQGDVVICGWKLPDELLLPSGEIVREGQAARSLLRPLT